jgi:5'-nucleotidase
MDDAAVVQVALVHFNDVYEIAPVSGGTRGGLARVATLVKALRAANPNTLVTFAGDLYNPSGLGTALVDGERLDGRQMVAVMNTVGIDYMTFGDHELNTVTAAQFADRLAATQYKLISSNIFDAAGNPFVAGPTTVLEHDTVVLTNAAGRQVRIALFGLTKPIRLAQVPHTHVQWQAAAAGQIAQLQPQSDLIIALTHQPLAIDQAMVQQFPAIDLVLGGDEHAEMKVQTGAGLATIYKAASNARSVYIIDLDYNTDSGELRIKDRSQAITDALVDDPVTLAEAERWIQQGFDAFRAEGWEPTMVVGYAPEDLDGMEATIRHRPTPFTDLITDAMMTAAPGVELAIICSWAVRLDDQIPAGSPITNYDLIRTFSLGTSPIYAVAVPGTLLREVLDFGAEHVGSGSYLLTSANVTCCQVTGGWQISNQPLDSERPYLVALADDMLHDYLHFINPADAGQLQAVGVYENLNQALIRRLGTADKS